MRPTDWESTRRLTLGVWLVGAAFILLQGRFFPDILLLIGLVRCLEGFRHSERRDSRRSGLVWLAIWLAFTLHLGPIELLFLAGGWMILSSLWRRPGLRHGKPAYNALLD